MTTGRRQHTAMPWSLKRSGSGTMQVCGHIPCIPCHTSCVELSHYAAFHTVYQQEPCWVQGAVRCRRELWTTA
jgi:hypothetical protein